MTLLTLCGAVHWAAAAVDPKAARYYEDALDRYERRDLPGAIIQLKNALQIDRSMLPVQVLLGKALLGNGDAATAELTFVEALRLGVNRAEVAVPLAQTYIAQGKQQLVIEQSQFKPDGLRPDVQLQLLVLRAAAATDLGDFPTAMKALEDAHVIDSKSADVWLAEVPIRVRNRQLREATAAVDRALALAPGSAEAIYQRGTLLHLVGNLNGAITEYDRALAINPRHSEARVARAGLKIDLGRDAEAAKDVAELRQVSPLDARGAYLAALLAERGGDAAAARAALQRVTALIDPVPLQFIRYRPQVLMLNGLAHFGLGEKEKAKPYLEGFQRSQPYSAVAKLLAQIYLSESNAPRAVEVLETYVKSHANDGQAITLLASAHMSQGRHARATALLQEALRTRDTPEFRTALGLSLAGGGKATDAVVQLESALKQNPAQIQAAATLATLYLRRGQAPRSVQLAEDLVKRQPGNAGFFNLLGMARSAAGDNAGARTAFEQSLKLDGSLLPVKLNLARLEILSKSFDAAATRLAALNKADENNAEVLFELALLAERRGQIDAAQTWLQKAADKEGPRKLAAALSLVEFHLRRGNAGPALEAAKRAASKVPDDLQALLAYARAQIASGDAPGARANLGNATRIAAFDTPLQVEIASLQLAAGNPAGAAYSLEKALSTQPDHVPALALLADVELRQGETAKAEQRARRIVELSPRRALGHGLLGDVASARGQTAAAMQAYRRAHEVEPSSMTVASLFQVAWQQDNGRTSLALAEQWIKTHPRDVRVRKAAADGYARSGNFRAARTAYEAVLGIVPNDAEVLNNLANVLSRLKDPSAVGMAERALAARPNSAEAIDTLGWILFRDGQVDRALQLLRDARLRDPDSPEIRYHLAAVLAQAGRKSAAQEELQAALKMGRAFESAADAQSLLKQLQL